MLVIATDYNSGVKGQLNNPSKLTLLGKAAALGAFMKLYSSTPDVEPAPGVDADSDDKVALRAWWTLIALDRWNATGSAMPQLITQRSAVIYPGLKHIIGDAAFLFARKYSTTISCGSVFLTKHRGFEYLRRVPAAVQPSATRGWAELWV